jgi:tetratricopeptide (TPR) repeat protein
MRTIIVVTALAFALSAHAATPIAIRAYVDAGYAKADPQKKAQAAVAEASKLLEAATGTPLNLVETKAWTPSPAAAKNLRAAVGELASTDKGADALVVGFIGAQAQAGADYHKLSLAKPLAKQAAVRDAGDAHEDAMIVLHAVAHMLAGVDSPDATTILSASYAKEQSTFADDSLALMKLGVTYAQAKSDVEKGNAAAQIKRELGARKAKLDPKNAEDLAQSLDELASTASSEMVLPPDQAKIFNDSVALLNAKDYAGAFTKLKPLADKPDAPGRVLTVACRLDGYDGVVDKDAANRCERALKATSDVDTVDSALHYAQHAHDAAMLKRAFAEGHTRLARVKVAGAEVDELAAIAYASTHFGLADEAFAKSTAPNAASMRAQIAVDRKREGLPAGMLSDDDEAGVIEAMKVAAANDKLVAALSMIDDAIKKYGEVPGLLVERCDLMRKREKYRDAEPVCELAVERFPDGSTAHMVAGMTYFDDVTALNQRNDTLTNKAMKHLEKAIAIDPGLEQSWLVLDGVYHMAGKKSERAKLQSDYQVKFGKPLPAGN